MAIRAARQAPVGRAESAAAPVADAAAVRARERLDAREWVIAAVARYEMPLARYAAHLLGGDTERAGDLVQEAFLRLCDQEPARIGPHLAEWLYTVCRNLAIDQRRKERRMRMLSEEQADAYPADDASPIDAAERDDAYSHVLRAMDDLSGNQQEVIRLKFQHGLSYKQISEITRLSVTNVGFLIHTGLKALRLQLGELGTEAME